MMKFLKPKKYKVICLAASSLMTSEILFFSGINADAEEVIANSAQIQNVLSDNSTVYDGEPVIQERGWEWIGDVLGAIGNAAHPVNPQQVIDQLNGKYPHRGPVHSCVPGGTGGTPNACNFR
ncbi:MULTISPECIES: hypothetical protein [Bacillota]|uniref:hypothetical protein n=1 Tax=Bacillota TaxID=1239 RepID=UPI00248B8E56|nr:hypothetical protein [Thomasclavelia cocleata]GMG59809.1 hypothetical protein AH4_31690 [Enterococcus gallinarum]